MKLFMVFYLITAVKKAYYNEAQGIIFVYDVTKIDSFLNIDKLFLEAN